MFTRWLSNKFSDLNDRVSGFDSYEEIQEKIKSAHRKNIPIKFLGLWDTVDAYGMPIEELQQGINWVVWPTQFANYKLSDKVERACHALALDDERKTFHPRIWREAESKNPERILQVWFAGMHSNVGGGYPDDQLSYVSLEWIMSEARSRGVLFEAGALAQVSAAKSAFARIYDSRKGLGAYYRYAPREIDMGTYTRFDPATETETSVAIAPIVHGSVIMRMARGTDDYAPISLPKAFWVLAPDGKLLRMDASGASSLDQDVNTRAKASVPMRYSPDDPTNVKLIEDESAALRAAMHELNSKRPKTEDEEASVSDLVSNTVFWRKALYVLTMTLTFYLIAYPLTQGTLAAVIGWIPRGIASHIKPLANFGEEIENSLGFDGSAGGITDVLFGVIGSFLPGPLSQALTPWKLAVQNHFFEATLLAGLIVLSLLGSTVLQMRIRDRSRLGWSAEYRDSYPKWLEARRRGAFWGASMLLAFLVLLFLLFTYLRFPGELRLLLVPPAILALIAAFGLGGSKNKLHELKGGVWLDFAGVLRKCERLKLLYGLTFERLVPLLFGLAVLLVLLTPLFILVNHPFYLLRSVSGAYCNGNSGNAHAPPYEASDFSTDQMCWASGIRVEKGKKYRVTLTTPGDWFDKTLRADPIGFKAKSLIFVLTTPLKRRPEKNWFVPIVKLGREGNVEMTFDPSPAPAPTDYSENDCKDQPAEAENWRFGAKLKQDQAAALMKCAPTPIDRQSVSTTFTASATDELFLYVNDAVPALPIFEDVFVANNRGTGTLRVEEVQEAGPAKP